jgi:Calcineurin-like phosphoesterase
MTNSKKLRLNVTYGLKLMVVILALACCGYAYSPVQSASPPTRDWTRYPAVVEIDKPPGYIFAVSDLHGHIFGLSRILIAAGLMEFQGPHSAVWGWKGGNAVLVVVGDLIDSRFQPGGSLGIIKKLRELQALAARDGGQVIVTMGNHEAEFLANWNNDHAEKFRAELTAAGLNPQSVANCQGDLGQWLCHLPLAARVGEWFFAHAGYTKGRTISQLNSDIARSFNDERENGFKAREITKKHSILNADLDNDGPGGRPWFKDGNRDAIPEEVLRRYTAALGVRHIVQGHKPGNVDFKNGLERSRGELFHAYGLLFLIDGDMNTHPDSGDDNNYGAALRIQVEMNAEAGTSFTIPPTPDPPPGPLCWTVTTQAIAIKKDGSQKTFWKGTEEKRASGEPCT